MADRKATDELIKELINIKASGLTSEDIHEVIRRSSKIISLSERMPEKYSIWDYIKLSTYDSFRDYLRPILFISEDGAVPDYLVDHDVDTRSDDDLYRDHYLPHMFWNGLVVTFGLEPGEKAGEMAGHPYYITETLMEKWDISVDELFKDCVYNIERLKTTLYPADLDDAIYELETECGLTFRSYGCCGILSERIRNFVLKQCGPFFFYLLTEDVAFIIPREKRTKEKIEEMKRRVHGNLPMFCLDEFSYDGKACIRTGATV